MIILASSSPRRKQLLSKIISDFVVQTSDIDEEEQFLSSESLSYDLSKQKAYEVFRKNLNDIVIACDTVVVLNDVVYGKPKDEQDAYRMLKILSNRRHIVLSSYTIISKDFEFSRTIKSSVYFNELDDEKIRSYIASGSPMDKAGAYGCQDEEFNLIKKIDGSVDNVMGFPTESIRKTLKKLKVLE